MSEPTKKGLVPVLRFPEFLDAGEWKSEELGDKTTKVGSGITPTGGDKNYKTHGRPFVRSQNIGWGHLILDDVAYIDDATHSTFSASEIEEGDVLLNITGASIGRSAIANRSIKGGNVNQHVCIIRTHTNKLAPFFLNQFLLSQIGQSQIDSFQAGGNRQGLNFAQIRSFSIPLPPKIEEQQKIADCLSSIDELVTAQTQKIEALNAHKKGLMQQLFPAEGETFPRLRFPEFRDAGEWEEKELTKFCACGLSNGVFNDPKKVGSGYKLINVLDMYIDTVIDEEKLSLVELSEDEFKKNKVEKGDIFFTRSSLVKSGIAYSNIYLGSSSDITFDGHLIRFRPDKKRLIPIFANYLLRTNRVRAQLVARGKSATMTTIGQADVGSVKLSVPEQGEQQKIADCLSSIDDLITTQTQKLAALKAHKKGLMQQLFPAVDLVTA